MFSVKIKYHKIEKQIVESLGLYHTFIDDGGEVEQTVVGVMKLLYAKVGISLEDMHRLFVNSDISPIVENITLLNIIGFFCPLNLQTIYDKCAEDFMTKDTDISALYDFPLYGLGLKSRVNAEDRDLCETVIVAAKRGHLVCIKRFHAKKHEITLNTVNAAARHGQLECLKYLIEDVGINVGSCVTVIVAAIENGHLDCLEYLLNRGSRLDEVYIATAIRHEQMECLRCLCKAGCPMIAWNSLLAAGKIEFLKYLIDNGCPKDEELLRVAIEKDSLESVKYLLELGYVGDAASCETAATHGRLEILKYLRMGGCPWTEDTCIMAAGQGHLDCLKYACENGCYCPEETFIAAAECGNLESIKYLHEVRCPWSAEVCTGVACHGHLECLQYLHTHGCPWDENAYETADEWSILGRYDCKNYLRDNGCPGSEL
jgi:hypothetical protein